MRLRSAWSGFWETSSYVCVTFAVIIAYFEYSNHLEKENMDIAFSIYRELDRAYIDYAKLCLEHPKLDCYEQDNRSATITLNEEERIQQKILSDILSDLFESAYVHLVKFRTNIRSEAAQKMISDQWSGWETYINKFILKPSFVSAWMETGDGYDVEFRCYMRALIFKNRESLIAKKAKDQIFRDHLNSWLSSFNVSGCRAA
jgi:hypothetical protein